MKRELAAALTILALTTSPAASEGEILLPMHQTVVLELAHHVTSAYNPQGSRVFFRVAEDVVAEGEVVVRQGQVVNGTVGAAKKGRSFGRSGSIDLSVRTLEAVDGSLVPLDGELEWKGRSRTGATVGGVVALGVVGGFLVKGRSAVLEMGDVFETFVAADRQVVPGDPAMAEAQTSYLEAEASPVEPMFLLKIEKKKKLEPLAFRLSPPEGTTTSEIDRSSVELFRAGAVDLPAPVSPQKVVNEGGSLRAQFDAWQVVSYCAPGPCELEFRGRLDDDRTWTARTELLFEVKKKEPKQ